MTKIFLLILFLLSSTTIQAATFCPPSNNIRPKTITNTTNYHLNFVPKYNNLGGFKVFLGADKQTNINLYFSIKHQGETLFENNYFLEKYQQYQYFPIGFTIIEDSQNNQYQIDLTIKTDQPTTIFTLEKLIELKPIYQQNKLKTLLLSFSSKLKSDAIFFLFYLSILVYLILSILA